MAKIYMPKRVDAVVRPIGMPDYSKTLIRPDDLLVLTFDFFNVSLRTDMGPPFLEPKSNLQPLIVIHFQPQSIVEKVLTDYIPHLGPIPAMASGPSRLAFRVSKTVKKIDLDLKSLLDWTLFDHSLAENALSASTQNIHLLTGTAGTTKKGSVALIKKSSAASRRKIGSAPSIRKPTRTETSIEFPYHIVLSPLPGAAWAHSTDAVSHNNRIEIWHTRLSNKMQTVNEISLDQNYVKFVRAIWSPEWSISPNLIPLRYWVLDEKKKKMKDKDGNFLMEEEQDLFETPLSPRNRYEIVRLSSDFKARKITKYDNNGNIIGTQSYQPLAVEASRLILSSLGSWAQLDGYWEDVHLKVEVPSSLSADDQRLNNHTDLVGWNHRATSGRDNFVRVVKEGILYPVKHKAIFIEETQRRFDHAPPMSLKPSPGISIEGTSRGPGYRRQKSLTPIQKNVYEDPPIYAYTFKRYKVVLREHLKIYDPQKDFENEKGWPFKSITITNQATPNLDPPANDIEFWPILPGGKAFHFDMIAVDLEGNTKPLSEPLYFIEKSRYEGLPNDYFKDVFNDDISNKRREWDLHGQKIQYAIDNNPKALPQNTQFETAKLTYATTKNLKMEKADVRIDSLKQLLGKGDLVTVGYYDDYLLNGFGKGGVCLKLEGDGLKMDIASKDGGGAERTGGIAVPKFTVTAISSKIGPVGGKFNSPSVMASEGKFNPFEYFNEFLDEAVLLGGIKLRDLLGIDEIQGLVGQALEDKLKDVKLPLDDAPAITTSVTGDVLTTQLVWKTKNLVTLEPFIPDSECQLQISSTIITKVPTADGTDPGSPSYDVLGRLDNFDLGFFKNDSEYALRVKFEYFQFHSINGEKPDFSVKLRDTDPVIFGGCLAFVNEIKDFIPISGFSDPPNLLVTPTGITAGYSLEIPSIGVGIFSLENVKFGAQLELPFTGDPVSLRLNFSERDDPFHISVAMFSGGGFFALDVRPSGIHSFEASLEFGGNISFDVGVASGGVYIYAGIYMHKSETNFELSGYLKCGGALEVLGLVCISIEFYMSLNYEEERNLVWGEATLTLKIDVLFFSKTIELTVRREFAHSDHYFFADTVTDTDWTDYCNAFAEEVVA
jgi:hypothetical protein